MLKTISEMLIFLVDAFTGVPFMGNPAGVCIVDEYPADSQMQKIAAYYNWSEISFLRKLSDNVFQIRWFSPLDEAPLCGHATLAAAHILFSNGIVLANSNSPCNKIKFLYASGEIDCILNENKTITMLFPEKPVAKCLSSELVVKDLIGIENYIEILKDDVVHVIVLNNFHDVQNAVPNFENIKKIKTRAIGITAAGYGDFDFVSRYFAPNVGIYEDPVCGSLHCRLAPYWKNVLAKKELVAKQLSKRTGVLGLDVDCGFVKISSRAITVCQIM